MRNILKRIIFKLIKIIETIQYRNHNFDEDNILNKIIDIYSINNLSVETDYGFIPIEEINITQPYTIYDLELENGLKLKCADNHILYTQSHIEKFVNDLTIDDVIITKKGNSKIKKITKLKNSISMCDLSVDSKYPSYYTNDILSHNTVSASIVILHYALFNNDKGIMVVANKSNTVKEIVRKIKDIYKLLPFYLKAGVLNWNEKSITFDNNCRIQSENRTTEPAIGFSIDLLYLDEFAKVPSKVIIPYYSAVVPTVSSISNSKIIITSTPDGFNLFHDLLIDAEREEDDPLKGMYTPLRVYWWQVKGRKDVKIFPLAYKLKEYNITADYIKEELTKIGYELYEKVESNKNYIYIKYDEDDDRTNINEVRKLKIGELPLSEICVITNWKEEQTKLIGGEDAFKQEFDLSFLTGNKLLFESEEIEKFKKKSLTFKQHIFDILSNKLSLPYNSLKWHTDTRLFNPNDMKKYYICAGVDLGEGLGQDYSIFNIFRLLPKSKENIEKNHENFKNLYDYFNLVQIGLFRSNIWRIEDELSELFYLIFFNLFDSEKVKISLEYNTYGSTLLASLPHVFNDENQYSNGIFLRYKHKKEDTQLKIGMKVVKGDGDAAKKMLVKNLQKAVKDKKMVIYNDININEISMFSKKVTPSGDFTYQCESGNDDTVTSLLALIPVFDHVQYKNMIEEYWEREMEADLKRYIEECMMKTKYKSEAVDYDSVMKNRNSIYGKNNNFSKQQMIRNKMLRRSKLPFKN